MLTRLDDGLGEGVMGKKRNHGKRSDFWPECTSLRVVFVVGSDLQSGYAVDSLDFCFTGSFPFPTFLFKCHFFGKTFPNDMI